MVTVIVVLIAILFITFLFALLFCVERDEHEDEEQMLYIEEWIAKKGGDGHKRKGKREHK